MLIRLTAGMHVILDMLTKSGSETGSQCPMDGKRRVDREGDRRLTWLQDSPINLKLSMIPFESFATKRSHLEFGFI
jgi:hypothetical protein